MANQKGATWTCRPADLTLCTRKSTVVIKISAAPSAVKCSRPATNELMCENSNITFSFDVLGCPTPASLLLPRPPVAKRAKTAHNHGGNADNSSQPEEVSVSGSSISWPPRRDQDAASAKNSSDADLLTLPPELFWNTVRPFTRACDRGAVTTAKRCTTRYNPGSRCAVDEELLEQYKKIHYGDECIVTYIGLPKVRNGFLHGNSIDFWWGDKYNHNIFWDQAKALEALRVARQTWDRQLSKLDSPAVRLRECLTLASGLAAATELGVDVYDRTKSRIFLPASGSVQDVIEHHISIDPRVLTLPVWKEEGKTLRRDKHEKYDTSYRQRCMPNNILGDAVAKYINFSTNAFSRRDDDRKKACAEASKSMRETIVSLLEAGADAASFNQTLENRFETIHHFDDFREHNAPGGIADVIWWVKRTYFAFDHLFMDDFMKILKTTYFSHEKKPSVLEVLETFSDYYQKGIVRYGGDEPEVFEELVWIINTLKSYMH